MAHRIRLKAAWRIISQTPEGVLWRRVFHCPTGLTRDTDVWLVIEATQQLRWLRLNGNLVFENQAEKADGSPLRLQIQAYLMPDKNVLDVMVMPEERSMEGFLVRASATPLHVIPVEVYLEIEEQKSTE